MLPKFLETLGGDLAKQWVAKILTPAFVFWFGGVLAWGTRYGWEPFEDVLTQTSAALPIIQLISVLAIVVASATIVQRLELPVLRLLEGYWPRWMQPIKRWCVKRQKIRSDRAESRFQILASQKLSTLTPEELEEYVQLDWQLKQTPTQSKFLMPTRLGNILRAAERRSLEKYGLESVICFPRLWLLLPNEVKIEITEARAQLNTMVRVWIWSVLFVTWGIWAWWAILVGIGSAWLAHRWMLNAAAIYGDLVESAFDLYRTALYQSLRWPLPKSPSEEPQIGQALTAYLWRGFTESELIFEELD